MSMFRIVQKLDVECVDDELLDNPNHTVGYVEDEFFAQEFCNLHDDCDYEQIIPIHYPIYLEANLLKKSEDIGLLRIPYDKRFEEDL